MRKIEEQDSIATSHEESDHGVDGQSEIDNSACGGDDGEKDWSSALNIKLSSQGN